MEDEAFFLFVVCKSDQLDAENRNGKEWHEFVPVIRRVSMQKPDRPRGDVLYKRINVDFDPLEHQQCYIVVLHAMVDDGHVVVADGFHFPAITLTEQEALTIKERVENGEYRGHLKKGEKFYKCSVMTAIITRI